MPDANKNFRSLLKKSALSALLCGFGFITYQIKKTLDILNNTLDTKAIQFYENRNKLRNSSSYIIIKEQAEQSISPYDRFWDAVTFSYAKRLLNLAQSDNREIRLRAVRSLAQIHNLDDWHYSLLAHMCDARTAIGLARSKNVDLRYFLNAPQTCLNNDQNHIGLAKWLQDFMISLNSASTHPCLAYFIKKKFVNLNDLGHLVEDDNSNEVAKILLYKHEVLPAAVESLLHHSTIGDSMYAKDIVNMDGLPLLMEIYKKYQSNAEIVISILKIISNISTTCPELLQDVFKSGWIGVLANLIKSDDIRISGPAARILVNLDLDDSGDGKYVRRIYLLHPAFRRVGLTDVDIIVVHGLLGGVFFTWRQREEKEVKKGIKFLRRRKKNQEEQVRPPKPPPSSDPHTREYLLEIEKRQVQEWEEIGKDYEVIYHDLPETIAEDGPYSCPGEQVSSSDIGEDYTPCWPKDWLPKDCKNIRIIGINYDSHLSLWAPACPQDKVEDKTLEIRSDNILERLAKVGVGKRPIVWLTHSMGGLVVKNILTKANRSEDVNIKNICLNSKGVVFYSTPHRGSHVASLSQATSLFLWPSVEVQELREGSPALLTLHEDFLKVVNEHGIRVLSFVETKSTIITPLKLHIIFVKNESAQIDAGEYYQIPLDHMRICKPLSRQSFIYQKVVDFINRIIEENDNKNKTVTT